MPRKTKQTQSEKPNVSQGRDNFQTPNYATDLLIPFIPERIKNIWECACGNNKIVYRLYATQKFNITATDLTTFPSTNFLDKSTEKLFKHLNRDGDLAIITNPPFSLKRKFFMRCLELEVPFALLIPADYCGWMIDAIRYHGCEKIIPDRRIDYITPSGLSGKTGHSADFHSLWLTRGFGIGKSETFVSLTKEMKENI